MRCLLSGHYLQRARTVTHHTDLVSVKQSWAPAIAMIAVYAIFFAEIAAYRIGSQKMAKLGLKYSEAISHVEHVAPRMLTL